MAYSENLACRVRALLAEQAELTERKMFGGLAFMLRGNMCCGVAGDELMVRVGPEQYAVALTQPHAREMDFTARSMRGMVMVAAEGLAANEALEQWVMPSRHRCRRNRDANQHSIVAENIRPGGAFRGLDISLALHRLNL